jgi:hypothetical protein
MAARTSRAGVHIHGCEKTSKKKKKRLLQWSIFRHVSDYDGRGERAAMAPAVPSPNQISSQVFLIGRVPDRREK